MITRYIIDYRARARKTNNSRVIVAKGLNYNILIGFLKTL